MLGEMGEAAFNLGRYWVEHFHRRADQEGISGDLKVADLRRWLDDGRVEAELACVFTSLRKLDNEAALLRPSDEL